MAGLKEIWAKALAISNYPSSQKIKKGNLTGSCSDSGDIIPISSRLPRDQSNTFFVVRIFDRKTVKTTKAS
jgi:hypothetical protein